jgi:hypothetical protein
MYDLEGNGLRNEQRVAGLLQTYHCKLPVEVTGPFDLTIQNSEDDREGIDVWVGTTLGRIGIQVKGRRPGGGKNKKRRREGYYHSRGIGYICVRTYEGNEKSDDRLLTELIGIINRMLRKRKAQQKEKYNGPT